MSSGQQSSTFWIQRFARIAPLILIAILAPTQAVIAQIGDWSQPPGIKVTPAPPPVRLEPASVELGDVRPQTKTHGRIQFFNDTDEPLRILATRNTCSCTTEKLTSEVIPPGESVELAVSFESRNYFGHVQRYVRVLFEGYAQPIQVLINANVNDGVRAQLDYAPLGQNRTGVVSLTSVDGKPFSVVSVDGRPAIGAGPIDPGTRQIEHSVAFDLSSYSPEQIPQYLLIEVDHPDATLLDLPIINNEYIPPRIRPMWTVRDRVIKLSPLAPGETREVIVPMLGTFGDPLTVIQSLRVDSSTADVQLIGMSKDGQGLQLRFAMTPREIEGTLLQATVHLKALDYESSLDILSRVINPPASPSPSPESDRPGS